jgi:hypothetical protein
MLLLCFTSFTEQITTKMVKTQHQEALTEEEGSFDLLVLTNLDQLLFTMQTLFTFLQNKLA